VPKSTQTRIKVMVTHSTRTVG